MNSYGTGNFASTSNNTQNPFTTGIGGSRTTGMNLGGFAQGSTMQGQNSGVSRPGFNTAISGQGFNPVSSAQTNNPFASGSGLNTGNNVSPFSSGLTATGGNPFSTAGISTSSNLNAFTSGGASRIGTGAAVQGSSNPFSSSGNLGTATFGTGTGAGNGASGSYFVNSSAGISNPFSSGSNPFSQPSLSSTFPGQSSNPFSSQTQPSGFPPTLPSNSTPISQSNPFSSTASQFPASNPMSTFAVPLSQPSQFLQSNPFASSISSGSAPLSSLQGGNTFTSTNYSSMNPAQPNNFFLSSSSAFPSFPVSSSHLYSSNPTPTSMNPGLISGFSGNFEEPGIWRYKKIENIASNIRKVIFDIQRTFDKDTDNLSLSRKNFSKTQEEIKRNLETSKQILTYSMKVYSMHKRVRLSIEVIKKFESDVVTYVRDIIKVCEFCERADYYNQVNSPAEFVVGILDTCDKKLQLMDECIAQVEEMIKCETQVNVFTQFCQVIQMMTEKYKIVAGITYDVHLLVDQFFDKLKIKFSELKHFNPTASNYEINVKIDGKDNKENKNSSNAVQFRSAASIKELISAVPSQFTLK